MIKRVSMIFFETFVQKQNDNLFFRDPNRRLIKENQEKYCQEALIISKTWNKQGMRTTQGGKKQEMKHRRREGSKNKDMISCRKIDHRNF